MKEELKLTAVINSFFQFELFVLIENARAVEAIILNSSNWIVFLFFSFPFLRKKKHSTIFVS